MSSPSDQQEPWDWVSDEFAKAQQLLWDSHAARQQAPAEC
jgi:hypothetical protein